MVHYIKLEMDDPHGKDAYKFFAQSVDIEVDIPKFRKSINVI